MVYRRKSLLYVMFTASDYRYLMLLRLFTFVSSKWMYQIILIYVIRNMSASTFFSIPSKPYSHNVLLDVVFAYMCVCVCFNFVTFGVSHRINKQMYFIISKTFIPICILCALLSNIFPFFSGYRNFTILHNLPALNIVLGCAGCGGGVCRCLLAHILQPKTKIAQKTTSKHICNEDIVFCLCDQSHCV